MPILWGTPALRDRPPAPPGYPLLTAGVVGTFILLLVLLSSS
jgi:hypothetical protein